MDIFKVMNTLLFDGLLAGLSIVLLKSGVPKDCIWVDMKRNGARVIGGVQHHLESKTSLLFDKLHQERPLGTGLCNFG